MSGKASGSLAQHDTFLFLFFSTLCIIYTVTIILQFRLLYSELNNPVTERDGSRDSDR